MGKEGVGLVWIAKGGEGLEMGFHRGGGVGRCDPHSLAVQVSSSQIFSWHHLTSGSLDLKINIYVQLGAVKLWIILRNQWKWSPWATPSKRCCDNINGCEEVKCHIRAGKCIPDERTVLIHSDGPNDFLSWFIPTWILRKLLPLTKYLPLQLYMRTNPFTWGNQRATETLLANTVIQHYNISFVPHVCWFQLTRGGPPRKIVPCLLTMMLSSAMAGTYAPPAVHEPRTTAI